MGAYRIGRIQEPWVQMTPPIRGGLYRKIGDDNGEEQEEDHSTASGSSEDDEGASIGSALTSLNSSSTSLEIVEKDEWEGLDLNHNKHNKSVHNSSSIESRNYATNLTNRRPTTDAKPDPPIGHYDPLTAKAMQAEIDKDLNRYPSLDAATQRNITLKYQALHQRVKDEGYYDCRYSEYGKELIRYISIFTIFILALRAQWFLTAACFLGLFWVRLSLRNLPSFSMKLQEWLFLADDGDKLASNHVHSPRRRSSGHHP